MTEGDVLQISMYGGKYRVDMYNDTNGSTHPTIEKPTKLLAAARVLQMMDVKEQVSPQSHPESIGIDPLSDQGGDKP
ncbi:hypothetical protein UFOVP56_58 [uncultured Caudovirales phage]|uniref:Uncharacterized protein n=1 Tax=uncultured Caudovirales phage TaxID=2100421 RepID=A0A6J5TB33_9CAUD|nr:hypothetical protein UFOVP56_58 [uncultured Caudovirales phage]